MASVDPFVIQWPRQWMEDDEIRPVIEYLNRFLHDLFIRTGGGDDSVSDSDSDIFDPGIQLVDGEGLEDIDDIGLEPSLSFDPDDIDLPELDYPSSKDQVEVIGITANYTTTGDQIVVCSNTAAITVTLNANPDDGEQVHIKRQGTALVTVSGAIDGDTSKDITFRYDSPHLVFTIDAGEWSII